MTTCVAVQERSGPGLFKRYRESGCAPLEMPTLLQGRHVGGAELQA
jgi:hypothetical protein